MLYYILFFVLAMALFSRIVGKKSNKTLFWGAVVVLILYCSIRDGFLYPDIQNYYDYFKYGYTEFDFQEQFNMGYGLLNKICKFFYPSFQFLLIVITILIISLYAKSIKDYSPYIWLSLILYVLINYYPSFFLLRQYLAMGVFLYSLKYIINRNPIRYGICMLIALSFHTTALIAVPLYFLYGIRNSKLNMLLVLIGAIAVIAVFFSFSTYIGLFSAYYAHYFEVEMEESAWKRAIMKGFIFLAYMFILRKHFYDKGINRVVFYCMVLNIVICVAAMNVMGVFRLREYFALADFIGIPVMVQQTNNLNSFNKMVGLSLIMVYVALLVMSFHSFIMSENMNDSYQFFWENRTLFK